MSKNQKLINTFKEFFDNKMGADSYDIKEFSLSGNFPLNMLVKAKCGGSEGGSCWGGTSNSYTVEHNEIVQSISEEIEYGLRKLVDELEIDNVKIKTLCLDEAKNLKYNDIGESSDGSDYYGNYTSYKMFAANVIDILKEVMKPEQFEILQGVASTVKRVKDTEFKSASLLQKEQEIVDKIDNFSETKIKEQENIQKSLANAQNMVERLTTELQKFDSNKKTEKTKLENQLTKVREERLSHEGSDVTYCQAQQKQNKKNKR